MDYHKNARTTVWSREQMARRVIEQGCTLAAAAAAANVSAKTASKWVRRYREQGAAGLADRTCRPHRLHRPTRPAQAELVEQLRRQRWTGLRISQQTGLSRATVSRILRRRKLNRMRDLEPRQPVERYEHERPGDLLHLDIKKLGRIVRPGHRVTGNPADRTRRVGWEYVHVAIDDHSRIAFSAIFADEKAGSTVAFLQQALDYYARFGIRFKAVLTDNGPAYRSRAFAVACRTLGLKHRFTRPYTPRTNGNAERFIRTALQEWAYVRIYQNSEERESSLTPWIHEYNWHRPHASLNLNSPISRAGIDRNNLLTLHN
jgi:transposase InsO family protein